MGHARRFGEHVDDREEDQQADGDGDGQQDGVAAAEGQTQLGERLRSQRLHR